MRGRRQRDRPSQSPGQTSEPSFRNRYDDLERKRDVLIARLDGLGEYGRTHPSAGKAMVLLNRTFRKASVVQRVAILQAADWLISLIEFGSGIV